jgi:hypothetical protein
LLPRLLQAKSLNCESVILFISVQAVALIDAEKMVQLWRVDTAHSLAVREKRPPIHAIYLIKRSFCKDILGTNIDEQEGGFHTLSHTGAQRELLAGRKIHRERLHGALINNQLAAGCVFSLVCPEPVLAKTRLSRGCPGNENTATSQFIGHSCTPQSQTGLFGCYSRTTGQNGLPACGGDTARGLAGGGHA